MATTITRSPRLMERIVLNKILLSCGILSSLLYVFANVIVPLEYPGYSVASQTVSELSAVGTPTRQLWVQLLSVYSILLIAFGWGIWRTSPENRTLRIAGILVAVYAIVGIFWPPMHQREVIAAGGGTLTDTLHIAFTFITVPLMLLIMAFSTKAFAKSFRIYTVVSVVIIVGFGILTGLDSPRMAANLSTPWMGIWERLSIGAYMVWVIVLAMLMLRTGRRVAESQH